MYLYVIGILFILLWMLEEQSGQKKNCQLTALNFRNSYALSTLPLLKQEVHTYNFLGVPFTLHFTDLMLDFHILFVFLLEWLTLLPK